MATWKDDNDITRDMDILSGIRSPCGKAKSYSTWARGQNIHLDSSSDFDRTFQIPEKTHEEFRWFEKKPVLEKFPDNIGRGKKLEILKENLRCRGREEEVQEQLRAAMGPGHSNAFIESSFKRQFQHVMKSDHQKLHSEQFEDVVGTECQSPVSDHKEPGDHEKNDCSTTIGQHGKSVADFSHCVSQDVRRKKKKRQYRNAVLESLSKLDNSGNIPSGNTKSDDLSSTVMPSFGKKCTNIPPAGYFPGKHSFDSSVYQGSVNKLTNEPVNSFVMKESEFPKL